jgi:nucleoside-triphosphatase
MHRRSPHKLSSGSYINLNVYQTEIRFAMVFPRKWLQAVGLGGHRAILAHIRYRSLVSVGRYCVEPDHLVPLIEEELNRTRGTVDTYLIDEIGKMECHCPQFIEAVSRILERPVPLLASIALRGGGFIAEVKNRQDVQIVEVTNGNRQSLPGQIATWVKQRAAPANTS